MTDASDFWQKSAREKLKFILVNFRHLEPVKGGPDKIRLARDYKWRIDHKGKLSIEEVSRIDDIYEAVMKAAGFPSVGKKHDFVKRY